MSNPLKFTHQVLKTLVILNVLYGIGILALLVASFVAPGPLVAALKVKSLAGARLIMGAGIVTIPINHTILARLQAIVDSVRAGDPFVVGNARRLDTIAWSLLGLEIIRIAIVAIASSTSIDIDLSFSITAWLAVLLLFVLARVFDHGARMRADLEGTV
jgi:hypothetical protein